eukprot:Blabericola_migrator_1__4427@NODE_2371_length_2860_cov_130_620122_g1485_i0_p1_GENE_NODE_2371_length_2860_cov_130_620122_g1485_i0NODE_2371_length_2860_cov_130_620122_g1485_i0_p1_ORF_typecomplete_len410_score44_17Glycos_transf_4/PF00953_21/4_5e03Glycos_transf_4/PF00953_21/4_9e42DUF2567/PF10821_8/0_29DUF2177/PF09945_9/0_17DUF2177/PF09945_9/7_4e02Mtp/PF03821_16/9e03Mtp/PF03821_16/5_7e02Mtp/PF03821_16/0_07_NODE_2371_length_2860_cov_130_620122_g1485_i011842413
MSQLRLATDALAYFAYASSLTGLLLAVAFKQRRGTQLLTASVIGSICYWAVYKLTPTFACKLKQKGLSGCDINKQTLDVIKDIREGKANSDVREKLPQVPEALGIVPGFLYVIGGVISYLSIQQDESTQLAYISGLLCVTFITFLGFVDDVLDLRWRYKVIMPLFAAIPLIVIYQGPTSIILPSVLKPFLPFRYDEVIVFELGILYRLYMASLIIFCSNAINIYAGLNGLEIGQSMIINLFIAIHNGIEIFTNPEGSRISIHHTLSLTLAIIFMFCTTALFVYNKYPAKIFVGDTFTYFAGVHFAVVGIVGHFAKTLLLFFLPQIMNFLLSCPQLFGIIPCPRHRVPILDSKSGKLVASPNLTIINMTLRLFGPMGERELVSLLLGFQVLCGCLGLFIRYSALYNVLFL